MARLAAIAAALFAGSVLELSEHVTVRTVCPGQVPRGSDVGRAATLCGRLDPPVLVQSGSRELVDHGHVVDNVHKAGIDQLLKPELRGRAIDGDLGYARVSKQSVEDPG